MTVWIRSKMGASTARFQRSTVSTSRKVIALLVLAHFYHISLKAAPTKTFTFQIFRKQHSLKSSDTTRAHGMPCVQPSSKYSCVSATTFDKFIGR
ncbi:hypothetical protein Y032_0040g279 [Ancylostoma ceylanicum]|uniref:Uncharacterized protein n=1 Tax=Ancylostoma ceylanicum TaxID=53326 RepID=A0A016UGV8_9BILA|nr:hypothetical protein Y032_0040g279 [Ancylostoma ceylanicum]